MGYADFYFGFSVHSVQSLCGNTDITANIPVWTGKPMLHCGHNSSTDKKWTDSRIPIWLHNVSTRSFKGERTFLHDEQKVIFLYLLQACSN